MVPGGQGVGLQGPRGSRVRPTGSQGVKGEVSGVPKDQQRHLMGALMIVEVV